MDKLKPVLEHKFWILLFLALLLPTIGWFIASGSYAEEIERRKGELDTAFSSVSFTTAKNQDWISHAKELVENEDRRLQVAQKKLSDKQKMRQTWPRNLKSMMADVAFKGEVPVAALEAYPSGYELQLTDVEEILHPFDVEKAEGVILYDRMSITHVPYGTWDEKVPTPEQLWNAQEDLWLTQALFESIAALNKGATKLPESSIRQLLSLHLRGGSRDAGGGGTTGEGGEESSDISEGMAESMAMSGGEFGGGESGTSGKGFKVPPAQFDLSDELGPDSSAGGLAGEYGGDSSSAGMSADSSGGEEGGDSETEGTFAATAKRYVDDAEDLPFRTRAFVLGVVMDHRQLNNFLVSLSSSDWPLQVIRVSVEMVNPDQLSGPGTRGGMASGGYMPGGEYGMGGASFNESDAGSYMGPTGAGNSSRGMTAGGFGGFSAGQPSNFNNMTSGMRGRRPAPLIRNPNADAMQQKALQDPFIARVWVGGLITLFKPLQETESQEQAAVAADAADAELNAQDLPDAATSEPAAETPPEAAPEGGSQPPDPGTAAPPPAEGEGSAPVTANPPESTEAEPPASPTPSPEQNPK